MVVDLNPFLSLYEPIYKSVYFATMLSTGFYGVTCMQTFFYYVHYREDPWRIKSFVAVVWTFNTIHEALTIAGAYKFVMAALVDPISLLNGIPEFVLLFTSLVAAATQSFFVYRLYMFVDRNRIIFPLIFAPMVTYQLVATLVYVCKALYSTEGVVHVVGLLKLEGHFFMTMGISALSVAAAADILIAVFLTALLIRKRKPNGHANTAHVLQRLMVFVVNAGTWTAVFALLSAILLYVYPTNFIYAVFAFPLCSIYCNTLLANLNARAYIRGETTTHNVDIDLFAGSTPPTSESKRSRVISFRTSGNLPENHGPITFSPMLSSQQTISKLEDA